MSGKGYSYKVRLIVVGDSAVGKSSLLLRFAQNLYRESATATLGLELYERVVTVNKTPVLVEIWDTAGEERFRSMNSVYFRGAMGIILVFAVNSRESFEALSLWVKQIENYASEGTPRVLLANKCDLREERTVSEKEGRKLAEVLRVPYYETSASQDINVRKSIMDLVAQSAEKIEPLLSTLQVRPAPSRVCRC